MHPIKSASIFVFVTLCIPRQISSLENNIDSTQENNLTKQQTLFNNFTTISNTEKNGSFLIGQNGSPGKLKSIKIYVANDCQQVNKELSRDDLYKCVKNLTIWNPTRVLVTGGAGFVGSHLVDSLMLKGYRVTVCDNFDTGRIDNIEHWIGHPNFELLEHDVTDPLNLSVNYIYHLASPASPAHYMSDPIKTIKTNSVGSLNILDLAKRNEARMILASTSEVYGDPEVHPQGETYWGHVNPIGPRSCYDESKRLSESLAIAYQSRENLSIGIARIFNTYGPRMHPNDGRVVSNFITQAMKNEPLTVYGNGQQTRSFQFISDLVDGLERLMHSEVTSPVNLGNPNEMTIHSLAEQIRGIIHNSTSKIVFNKLPIDDPHRRRPDIRKATRLLDWKPNVTLTDGLTETIEYFVRELRIRK